MPDTESLTIAELLAEIAKHPPDDARHALADAVRACEADLLTAWMILGEDDDALIDYCQFLALGFVNGAFPPRYCMLPGVDDAESQRQVAEMKAAFVSERPVRTTLESVRHLLDDPVTTLIYAGYGRKRETGETVLAFWHHPGITLRRAVWLAVLAIESDQKRRLDRGS